jgi:hypothetical protein
MDQPPSQRWFLRKHEDGSLFGPISFEQLAEWASTAQIAPHDAISSDEQTWMKAPMLPQLGMDWLVEITSDRYYGPTTLGAIQEFMRLGEIDSETFIINACDGTRRQIQEFPALLEIADESGPIETEANEPQLTNEPAASGISIDLQDRIRDLEQSLREERRALEEAEERYRELEQKYNELLAKRRKRSGRLQGEAGGRPLPAEPEL